MIAKPNWSRRLSRFELALVTIVALVLLVTAIKTMMPVFAAAERESVRSALADMRSGLMLAATVALVRGDQQAIARLEHANPVELSPRPPPRYAGLADDANAAAVPTYHWYFDPQADVLGYRVAAEDSFVGGARHPVRARYRVRLRFDDKDGDRRFSPGVDTFTGIALVEVEPSSWR